MISGEQDPIWSPASLADLAPCFGKARQTVLPGTGHSSYFEQADIFNRTIAQFPGLTL
jgi:pimeloyl-ACP methyl ester carboxylesterase